MRQSIKKNIFLFLFILTFLICFPFCAFAGTYEDTYTVYVPSGGSYSQSGTNWAEAKSCTAVYIGYKRSNSGSYSSYSVSYTQGSKTYDDTGSGYYSRTYTYPRTKITTVYPGGCASADIYRECTADHYYDKYSSPKYNYSSQCTGEIVCNNITGTTQIYVKTYDRPDTNYNYYNIYICSSHTYGGYTQTKAPTC